MQGRMGPETSRRLTETIPQTGGHGGTDDPPRAKGTERRDPGGICDPTPDTSPTFRGKT